MRRIFLISLLLAGLEGTAQFTYHQGYVVTLAGDTLRGEVGRRNWTVSMTEFRLRRGDTVIRMNITNAAKVVLPGWETDERIKYGDWIFFAKVLVNSAFVTLLHNDQVGYFIRHHNRVEQLHFEGYEVPEFIGRLASLRVSTGDASWLLSYLIRVYQATYSVEAVVTELDHIEGAPAARAYRNHKAKILLSGGIGLALYRVDMEGSNAQLGHLIFSKATIPTLEINIESYHPWHEPRLSVFGGFQFFSAAVAANGTKDSSLAPYEKSSLAYRQTSYFVGGGLYYQLFSLCKDAVAFQMGFKGGIIFNTYQRQVFRYYPNLTYQETVDHDALSLGGTWVVADLRAGLIIRPLNVELTAYRQFPNAITGNSDYAILQSFWGATLSYRVTLQK